MTGDLQIRLHHMEDFSKANGPGVRSVIWTQGCDLHCTGCFNQATHARNAGKLYNVQSLAKSLKNNVHQIEGITISGGEPLLQIPALTKLLWLVKRQSNLSVILFSGFTWPQIQILPGIKEVMDSVDVLLAGPYQKGLRTPNSLAGSSNKTVHFLSKRYSIEDLQFIPPAEIIITTGGEIHLSGLDPIKW